jgi:hypothetical protein
MSMDWLRGLEMGRFWWSAYHVLGFDFFFSLLFHLRSAGTSFIGLALDQSGVDFIRTFFISLITYGLQPLYRLLMRHAISPEY